MEKILMPPTVEEIEVKLKVPKPLLDFLNALREFAGLNPEAYLERTLIFGVLADLENVETSLWDPKNIKEKYGISSIYVIGSFDC